ncbi:hypothetical protein LEN26_018711 [Aphanomyces euteiches]|nr:hypothetical protein LEN26_018711 [Aphanomyces euteiches]KAH9107334.1 hypothetical protein AeMF1_017275 [Aphanomyces euteiches]KAH9197425.1 hypothetical protein AeNC1_000584 [Aphanomyces euteiches]
MEAVDVEQEPTALAIPIVDPFVVDDVCEGIAYDLCNGIVVLSEAKRIQARVLQHTSQIIIQEMFAALSMVVIDRCESFDAMTPAAATTAPPPQYDSTGLQRTMARSLAYVANQRRAVQIQLTEHSDDGSATISHTALRPFLLDLPLFLSSTQVDYMVRQASHLHLEPESRIHVDHITKLCTVAVKHANKKAAKVTFRPPVVFPAPEEPPCTPHDAHTPHDLPMRPTRPEASPDTDPTRSTVRASYQGRGSKYSFAATIQTHKLSTQDVEVHVHMDPQPPTTKVDTAAMSNIFSLGTPRQLSPRELARRRDILSYLESIEAATAHEEMLAKKKKTLMERPIPPGEIDIVAVNASENDSGTDGADGEYVVVPTSFEVLELQPSRHEGHFKEHRTKSLCKTSLHKLLEIPKIPPDIEPIPDFHLPQIETNRLEVGVKVVYPGKEKVGGKRIPSRNSRLKLHNYHVKTPPLPRPTPPPDHQGASATSDKLPLLPISPIKTSQTQPAKPTAPAAPISLPTTIPSPIKPKYVRHTT